MSSKSQEVDTYYNNIISEIEGIQKLEDNLLNQLMYETKPVVLPQFVPIMSENCSLGNPSQRFKTNDGQILSMCELNVQERKSKNTSNTFPVLTKKSNGSNSYMSTDVGTNVYISSLPLGESEVDSNTLYGIPNYAECNNNDKKVGWVSNKNSFGKNNWYGMTVCEKKVDPKDYDNNKSKKTAIIDQISHLTNLRMKLYKNLELNLGTYQNQFNSSRNNLQNQLTMVGVVEQQLNNNKLVLNRLKDAQQDKIRMIEIGNYESERYNEYKKIMFIILATVVLVFLFSLLNNVPAVPSIIPLSGVVISITVGLIIVFYRVLSVYTRDNRNFLEFDWGANSDYNDPSHVVKPPTGSGVENIKITNKHKKLLNSLHKDVQDQMKKALEEKNKKDQEKKCEK